ncbi:hypothetical protein E2C01_062371 [Portunus trituberculatus]|uniref:Uncharacterized protein n=1 Tax=Portunus trituberculatus TaxID=210409 RepID=A0A5B7HHU3_PORTR|nr:hypothetical protein [Portunus trituberculatus]
MALAGQPPEVIPGTPTLVKLQRQKACKARVSTILGVNSVIKVKEKIRVVARVVGLLVTAILAVEMGKLYYKRIERVNIKALEEMCGNFNGWMDGYY